MKTKIALLILIMCGPLARGQEDISQSFRVDEPGIGSFQVRVIDVDEPVYAPMRLTLNVKCAGEGKWRVILNQENICDFRPHDYARATTVLTVHASSAKAGPGQAKCTDHWAQPFNLRLLCAGPTNE